MAQRLELMKGSSEPLLLCLLAQQPMYGYQILKELERRSQGYFRFKEGTLYPALHRLEREGLVYSEWQIVAEGPSRKYYHLTDTGRSAFQEGATQWRDFSRSLLKILGGLSYEGGK